MNKDSLQYFLSDLNRVGFNMNEKVSVLLSGEITLDSIVNIALSKKQNQARLLCWIFTKCLEKNPRFLDSILDKAVDFLPHTNHTGQTREILRWFTITGLPINNVGTLADFCFSMIVDMTQPVAVKLHAMNILEEIAKTEKDIVPEFCAIIQDIEPYVSVGGKNKIHRLLKKYFKQGLLQEL